MVSSAENRAAFISSLATFMETYGFQGVDIDWEYPSEPTRGGRKEDAANFVLLVKEMKTAFQHKLFGISVALAPDYWYLRGFRPGEMQEYVDFFGFMSYDLHGPWDTDVRALGSIVRPQTDVTDIKKDLLPLVYDDVEFSKINLGLAYYGRTYTLADPTCGKIGCGFVPGKGGSSGNCTRSTGILSLSEIRRLVDEEGAKPYLNSTAMVKYFTYAGSSWVGYDDSETLEMKRAFAEENCLGGTMIWSIDFDPETGGGEGPNENVSPESATVIPMAHTTVPRGSTFTLGLGAATDLPALPHDGNQNTPKGPGEAKCSSCSFFRLITSTCCGTGGSLGNPILISPGLPLPMDIPLPSGFIPNQPFIDRDGNSVPSGVPLPKETVIPRGTSFPSPFTIPAGQPFREGEGDDAVNNSTTIWISPNIWDSDHPQLKCFPPCTFVLPPWPNISTTLEYPRITWVDDDKKTKTTITFPIITKSSWPVETVVVDDDDPKNTKRLRTSTPVPRTTTWPPRTWSDHNGRKHTTTPTLPGPIPPPATMSLPLITIAVGAPFPLPSGCMVPCPPGKGDDPDNSGDSQEGDDPDTDEGDDPENDEGDEVSLPPPDEGDGEDEGDDVCEPSDSPTDGEPDDQYDPDDPVISSASTTSSYQSTRTTSSERSTSRTTTTTATTKPAPTRKWETPNFPESSRRCFHGGQWSHRGRLIQAIEHFCGDFENRAVYSGYSVEKTEDFNSSPPHWEAADMRVVMNLSIKKGCEWVVDQAQCREELRKPVDLCDTEGENHKHGGTLENNCIKWSIDPQGWLDDHERPLPQPTPKVS